MHKWVVRCRRSYLVLQNALPIDNRTTYKTRGALKKQEFPSSISFDFRKFIHSSFNSLIFISRFNGNGGQADHAVRGSGGFSSQSVDPSLAASRAGSNRYSQDCLFLQMQNSYQQ